MDQAEIDRRELRWWRQTFCCRFREDDLPKMGTPLYGMRLRVYIEMPGGEGEIPWAERNTAVA